MTDVTFRKTLSANDVGATGGHQGGILIPKSEAALLSFLPHLNPRVKNPDAWIICVDETGALNRFRFVYYNNKIHDEQGTRNEYRITHMTAWFKRQGAKAGDHFVISQDKKGSDYAIKIERTENKDTYPELTPTRLRLKGWQRVH